MHTQDTTQLLAELFSSRQYRLQDKETSLSANRQELGPYLRWRLGNVLKWEKAEKQEAEPITQFL